MRKVLKAALLGAAVFVAAPVIAGPYVGTVIATGLNNPRGLAFGPDGGLYVAESGLFAPGGPTVIVRGQTATYSETGSITRLQNGVQQRIVTGLASLAVPALSDVSGPNDIAFGADGTGYVVVGLGTNPAVRTTNLAPNGGKLGQVYSFTGGVTPVGDVAAYELANNPVGGMVDSNPFSVAAWSGGLAVTDAGSNTLLNVGPGGAVSLIAAFPPRFIGPPPPMSDSVPTGVVFGPDGNFYVSELTGFPFTQGAARILRVTPGGTVSVAYSGFTTLSDLAFGADGTLYALELDSNGLATPGVGGALIRINADGSKTTLFNQGLVFATGLAIGDDGAFYVSRFGNQAGIGEVLRIAQIPEPASWAMMIAGFAAVGVAGRRRARVAYA